MTCISTNGTFLDADRVDRLAATRLVAIQVSMDGARKETCEAIRGRGTHAAAIEALTLLARSGIPTSINTVLTSLNAARDPGTARDGETARRVFPGQPLSPLGARQRELAGPAPPAGAAARLLRLAEPPGGRTHRRQLLLPDPAGAPGARPQPLRRRQADACVGPRGDFYPCAFLQREEFLAGSIRTQTFQEMWDGAPIFESLRNLRIRSCEECQRFDQCHGGCPAVAYHLKNRIDGGDPECLERCVTSIADERETAAA